MARMLRTLSLLLCLFLLVAPVSPADAAPTDAAVGDEVVVAAYVLDRAPADGEQADLGGVAVGFEPRPGGGAVSEPVVLGDAEAARASHAAPPGARLVTYSSTVTAADLAASAAADAWPQPRILPRSAWGANESIVRYPSRIGEVTGAMVHHTATGNTYTAEQVPAVLRSIQAFHVNERGWNDIAYNVLIDRFGRAWEGRSGGVHRAVVGSDDTDVTNQRLTNISLLGNHEEVAPTAATMEPLAQVVAWKLLRHGVDPHGRTWGSGGREGGRVDLPAIHGHRDERPTLCPGRYVYSQMDALRTRVATIMAGTSFPLFSDVPNGTAFGTEIRWLADEGISTGWTDGTYRPLEPVARDAMAAFMHRAVEKLGRPAP